MRVLIAVFAVLPFFVGMFVDLPAAAAQPNAPPKTGAASTPPHEESAADDLFLPPLRGTPGGRISGGTRGIATGGLPSAQPTPTPTPTSTPTPARAGGGKSAVKSTPARLIPVAE